MKIFLITFFILFSPHAFAQQCICKHDGYIDSEAFDVEALDAYTFKNGNSLKICPSIRYYFDNDTTKYFKDFELERCNNDSIVFVGESYSKYLINQIRDSLILKEVFDLPTGANRKLERIVLSMITITTKGEKFAVNKEFNAIRKYSAEEIALTLKEYEKSNKTSLENLMVLISRMFVAALSDEKAKGYFLNMKARYKDEPLVHYQNLLTLFSTIQRRQL